jgi:hypothetical protein
MRRAAQKPGCSVFGMTAEAMQGRDGLRKQTLAASLVDGRRARVDDCNPKTFCACSNGGGQSGRAATDDGHIGLHRL